MIWSVWMIMDVRKPAEEMKRHETMDPSHPAFIGFVIAGCNCLVLALFCDI